jgi:TonB family protein
LENAQYLIVWSPSLQMQSYQQTVERQIHVNTTTIGQENGSFSTYGDLSTRGTYSGTSLDTSRTTISYPETVTISNTVDYASVHVIKSVGATVRDDIRKKVPEPLPIFSAEERGAMKPASGATGDTAADLGRLFGTVLSRAVRREPTAHVLDDALKFINAQPASAPASSAAAPAPLDLDRERYEAVRESRDPAQLDAVAAQLGRADLADILRQRAIALRSVTTAAVVNPPAAPGQVADRVGNGVSAPVPIDKVEPSYTEKALRAGIEGTVTLSFVVQADGTPSAISVLQSLEPGLDQKAMEAVSKWRFRPGLKDGKPVPVLANVQVNFRLNKKPVASQ